MSRRRGNGTGDVRGPTSALTSFLKDQGIQPRNIRNGFSRNIDDRNAAAGPSNAPGSSTPAATPSAASSPAPGGLYSLGGSVDDSEDALSLAGRQSSSMPGTPAGDDSGDLDLEEDVESSSYRITSISRQDASGSVTYTETVAEASTSKRKATARGGKAAKKMKLPDTDDENDAMDALKKLPKARYADRKPGSFAMCAECNKKFTITRYTNSHPTIIGGLLCGPCDKEIGPAAGPGGAFAKAAKSLPAAAKKKSRAVKNKNVGGREAPTVPTLAKSCIELIGQLVNDVDDFGDIGLSNKDKICKIVCKNRDLTMDTMKLFLDVETKSLNLYDCTRLEPEALRMLANHCPNLDTLRLSMCGFMDNETITHYAKRLKHLKHLQLYAAFLVRKEAWVEFFSILDKHHRSIESFMLRQSPRIDNSVLTALVNNTANTLTSLQLAEMGALNDASLNLLHPLKNLRHLDLSKGGLKGESYTDDGVVPLLDQVGRHLLSLTLDDNLLLTDRTLIEGIKVNCPELIELSLRNLGEILPTGVAELFAADWINAKGMVRINLHRCFQLDDQALEAIIAHSGQTVQKLDVNSVDGITEKSLNLLAKSAPNLTELDVSFVRDVDDFILKNLLDNLPSLKRIFIFGNNRVSDLVPSKAGVRILGHEQGAIFYD